MPILSLVGLINLFSSLSIGILVLIRNRKETLHRSCFIYIFSVTLYSLSFFMWHLAEEPQKAMLWSKIYFIALLINIPAYLLFVFSLTPKKLSTMILFSIFFIQSLVSFYFFKNTAFINNMLLYKSSYWPDSTASVNFAIITWCLSSLAGSLVLLRSTRFLEGLHFQQVKITGFAGIFSVIGGIATFAPIYEVPISPLLHIFTTVNIALIAYAILRYKLMDFNLLTRWSLAYGVTFLVLTTLFLSVLFFSEKFAIRYLSFKEGVTSLILCGLFVFIFPPIQKKINSQIDQFIFKSPDFQHILVGIQKLLNQSGHIEKMTQDLIEQFKHIWNVDHAGFAIWNSENTAYQLLPKAVFTNHEKNIPEEKLDRNDFLVKTLESERRIFTYGIVVDDEIIGLSNQALPGQKATLAKVRHTMQKMGAAAAVPLMLNTELIGFIILGPKRNNSAYHDEDKKFLSHVANLVSEKVKTIILSQPIDLTKLTNPH